jgi:hypothetical protein
MFGASNPEHFRLVGFKMRDIKLEKMRFGWFFMFGMLEPCGFIPHEHFSVFYLGSMSTEITPALHPDPGPILTIVEPVMKSLAGSSTLGRPDSESYGNLFHKLGFV